jgi:predicted TIM-barrel fold metal-dependent hydrolase
MTRPCLSPKQEYSPVHLKIPADACDSHVHIFGPFADFPLAQDRSYTPSEFSSHQFVAHLDRIGFSRGVLVTASVCGTNNGSILRGLQEYPDRFRGVVVPDANVSDQELNEWHELGVRKTGAKVC